MPAMATQKVYNNGHGRDESKKYVKTQADFSDIFGADDSDEWSSAGDLAAVAKSYPDRLTKAQVHGTRGRDRSRERRNIVGSDRKVDKGRGESGAASGGSVLSPVSTRNTASDVQARLVPTPEQQSQALKDELKALRDENETLSLHLRHGREQYDYAVLYIHHLEQDRSRMREAITGLENESSVLRQELADAKNLANIGGKELHGSQAFNFTKADTLSVSEVSKKLSNFNKEISQAAALLGETLVRQEYPEDERRPALTSVSEMLGLNIISIIVSESRKTVAKVNPILSQVVFRAFFVGFCTRLIEDWCPDDPEKSRALKAMYQDIRDTEEQTVFGPWRAVTRSRTKINPDLWRTDLLTSFDKLLVFAGWKIPSDSERTKIEGAFKVLLKAAELLRRALGEGVVSMDLHVYGVSAGMQFQPSFVDDVYGDANTRPFKASRAEVVIATVGFGLKKATREKSSSGQLQFIKMISAKVALETTLREALTESPPPIRSDPDATSSTVSMANPHPAIRTVGGVEQSAKYKIPQPDPGS